MNFTKIHYNQGDPKLTLKWIEQLASGNSEDHGVETDDPPLPSLHAALQALKPHFLQIMELDEDYGEGMDVLGVTLKWKVDSETGDRRIKSATISVKKKLHEITNDVVPISTPHTESGLSDACRDAIEALCEEAERFVDGDRAQGDLFSGEVERAEDRGPSNGKAVAIGETETVRELAEAEEA
jgi:hypothetical protein